jgi:hypothetical protein
MSQLGYIVSLGSAGTDGMIQAEGNFPLTYELAGLNTGRYEFNSADVFAIGDRVWFDGDADARATNVRKA